MKKQRGNQELLNKIAKNINQLREEKDISQDIFCIDSDIPITRIEVGKVNVTISTLQDICDYFKISLSNFSKDI